MQIKMTSREKLLRKPIYWFDHEQNEIFRQVSAYLEKEGINQSQLAQRLSVGKSYVSQIMNGNCNFSLKKWIELCVAIGVVPSGYKSLDDVIKEDLNFKSENESKIEPHSFQPYSVKEEMEKINTDSRMLPNYSRVTISTTSKEYQYGK